MALGANMHAKHFDEKMSEEKQRQKSFILYLLLLAAFLSVQFGHGSNIGVAVSLPGNSKAMNLALGCWVMLGVCIGLPFTPWACRTWGASTVCAVCLVIDLVAILLMTWPGIKIQQIYAIRFVVGFFEAPFLPYLQEWLAHYGKDTWNIWNSILHAMIPLGECLGYIVAQELVELGYSWQYAFVGQAAALSLFSIACCIYGGRKFLDLSYERPQVGIADKPGLSSPDKCQQDTDCDLSVVAETTDDQDDVEYPTKEKWAVFWVTNVSLAAQLGFMSGTKYVIRDYGRQRGFSVHLIIFTFSAIAFIAPGIGGSIAVFGSVIRPDKWSQHKKTLFFLACTSSVASGIAVLLPYTPTAAFWPALFACYAAAGGVYPAAQGIINIALTASRVVDASVYQMQCNNILFAMPIPYVIGLSMDAWGVDTSFRGVTFLQVLAASGFALATVVAACIEERSAWQRLLPHSSRQPSEASDCSTA
eukprot:CAMPEP_0172668748 /NCGR_PEP_ID=MMETSP1074-20121228/9252_1 /TAXON_ID=2916 /ORGANISM="Ceratium fusus, Strain PA161109" /LENGTH=474 /DNA_ID=CAMNT_0013485433 /DNA_START=75 /DNA_END=1499 /DNA_ORIENTATION=+